MQFLTLISLALSVSTAVGLMDSYNKGPDAVRRETIQNDFDSNKFIVEFSPNLQKRAPDGDHIAHFYRSLRSRGIEPQALSLNYTYDVFNGASFYVDAAIQIADLKAQEYVKNIWQVTSVPMSKPEVVAVGSGVTPTWSPHSITGVLDLHKQGLMGEGCTVAIVDTGIDYSHPSLGGEFGAGFKVIGGTDIVGDNFSGTEFFPDDNPMDAAGHGTHVAGIIAASNDDKFVSVAPKAKLLIYKVFGNAFEGTTSDAIIAGFLKAYEDGADVINASLGGDNGWSEDPMAVVVSRLVEKGVFIAISAGNSGATGPWFASSPATATEAIAVASVETETFFTYNSKVKNSTDTADVPYLPGMAQPFNITGTVPIYAISTDISVTNDACNPLPSGTPDLRGYVVLVRRGGCFTSQKEVNLVSAGAQWIFVYNQPNMPVGYPAADAELSQGSAMISQADGEAIVREIAAGKNVTVSFPPGPPIIAPNNITGGKLSTFTSWGPDYECNMKPEIAAPGGGIVSTYPLQKGSYAVLSGTSMASPYIAGIAALYIGKAGGRNALGPAGIKELKNKILTSGTLINFNDGRNTDYTRLASVAQQGAGYVNAKKLFYDTTVSPGKLELNDTQYFKGEHDINIRNTGSKEVFYTLSHEPAATVNSFKPNFADPQIFPPTFVNATASASFSVDRVSVGPGATNSFKVTITPPDIEASLFPIYSGKIVISGTNGEVLSVPYLGVKGRMQDINIWDMENGEPLFLDDNGGAPIDGPRNFTLQAYDRPAIGLINHFGASWTRWDIVTADWNKSDWELPPVEGKNGFVGSAVDVDNGTIFPIDYIPRKNPLATYYYYFAWRGELANGSMIAPGSYKMLLSTLKPFGNYNMTQDWQMKVSETINVVVPEVQ